MLCVYCYRPFERWSYRSSSRMVPPPIDFYQLPCLCWWIASIQHDAATTIFHSEMVFGHQPHVAASRVSTGLLAASLILSDRVSFRFSLDVSDRFSQNFVPYSPPSPSPLISHCPFLTPPLPCGIVAALGLMCAVVRFLLQENELSWGFFRGIRVKTTENLIFLLLFFLHSTIMLNFVLIYCRKSWQKNQTKNPQYWHFLKAISSSASNFWKKCFINRSDSYSLEQILMLLAEVCVFTM